MFRFEVPFVVAEAEKKTALYKYCSKLIFFLRRGFGNFS